MLTVQMPLAQEVEPVAPGVFLWQVYDRSVKADLFSTGLETPAGICLFDPIPLAARALEGLPARQKVAGIFVTNANHVRASGEFAKAFGVPIFIHAELANGGDFPNSTAVQDGEAFAESLTGIAIEGGPAGEMAVHHGGDAGTMVLGDALINFEPHGFGLLPAKYCQNQKLMRRSLKKLLQYPFERMLFAHGTPILSGARGRLEHLLND
jgi:glyoxylase-like metal-dependent hydrolase (beta-lactamase superfamily II)